MRGVGVVLARELRGYFNSVIAYIFIVVFLLVSCGLYMTTFFLQGAVEMRYFFGILPFILLVFLPAVTMRLWAEERVLKTDELLLTCPQPTWSIVLGKFLAAFLFYLCALAGTLTIPLMLAWLGDPDGGAIAGAYLGAVLLGAFVLALGLLLSGFARDQVVAFVLSLAVGFALYLAGTEMVATLLDGWLPGVGTFFQRALGLAWRFDDFARGVVPLQAVFFFLAGTALFLALDILILERRGRPVLEGSFLGGVVLFCVVTVLAVLVVSTLRGGRFDWTEENVYSVSPATRTVLADLKDRVRVRYFVSPEDKMPTGMKQLGRDVRDKLEELDHASGDRLDIDVLDPTDPDVAEKAKDLQVEPFQVQSIEQDQIAVKLIYSSLVLSYLDHDEVIPQVYPGNFANLEYEIVSRLYRLQQDKPPVVAVSGAVEEMDPQMAQMFRQMNRPVPPPREIYKQAKDLLRQGGNYQVRDVDLAAGDEIPADADTLVVLEPRSFDEATRDRIATFLHDGGNVVLAVQNHVYDYQPSGAEGVRITSQTLDPGIGPLLSRYGLQIADDILMDTQQEVLSIPARRRVGMFEAVLETPVRAPIQIQVVSKDISDSGAVGQVASLLYLWGSGIRVDGAKQKELGLKDEVLFTTTGDAWYAKAGAGLTAAEMRPEGHDKAGRVPLGVLSRGTFPAPEKNASAAKEGGSSEPSGGESAKAASAEPEGSDPPPPAGDPPTEDGDAGKPGRLVLFGSARMFSDGLIGARDNGLLLLNSVDAITLGPALVDIRGKTVKTRALETPSSGRKLWWRFFTVLLVPLLVMLAGLVRLVLRRRGRQRYRQGLLSSHHA